MSQMVVSWLLSCPSSISMHTKGYHHVSTHLCLEVPVISETGTTLEVTQGAGRLEGVRRTETEMRLEPSPCVPLPHQRSLAHWYSSFLGQASQRKSSPVLTSRLMKQLHHQSGITAICTTLYYPHTDIRRCHRRQLAFPHLSSCTGGPCRVRWNS